MSIYQELYKKVAYPSKCSKEAKIKCFGVWKDKRNQVFDSKRETLVYEKKDLICNDKENEKPNKNILIKWKNDRKNKVVPKKKPPFVVGVVRHKIYSPPFLHKSFKSTEQKKKIHRQSFAPKNYKFKPPEGLKINLQNPTTEKGISSPFTIKSLFATNRQIPANKKVYAFENVTMRPRTKPLNDSTPNRNTPKSKNIKKDVDNQKFKNVQKVLCANDVYEPPIFGKLNLLKFREKTAETNEVQNEVSSIQLKISMPEDNTCGFSCLKNQKQQETNITNENSAKKECNFKSPTFYSGSQQIQNLIERENLKFTKLHSNSESNLIVKRTSEMPSPNLSRISFTPIDSHKIDIKMTSSEIKLKGNIEKSYSSEYNGSAINDELNVTIQTDEDKEALSTTNLSRISDITMPENFHFKIISTDQTLNEEKDPYTIQDYLPSKIADSPIKRISKHRISTENEGSKSNKFSCENDSLNLSLNVSEFKEDLERAKKDKSLNGKETSLEKIELSLNNTKTLKNASLLEAKNNVLSDSNASVEKNTLTIATDVIISEENNISKPNVLNEQEALSISAKVTIESNMATETDNENLSLENLASQLTIEVADLPPKDSNFSLKNEIILSKNSLESDQKPVLEKNNLINPSDNFIEHKKSTILLNSKLSKTLTNVLSVDEMKKNKNNEDQTEIIDLSDSPLKQEKVDYEKNTNYSFSLPRESMAKESLKIENKLAETELPFIKVSDVIHLEDSPEIVKRVSESQAVPDKFSYHNLKEAPKSMSDDCKKTIVLKSNENRLQNSQISDIETVDLISDDEEDAETFLSHIKARFAITTTQSPKLNTERIALSSIENIQGSPCKTRHSQIFLKENSPKTQNISIFRDSPSKIPRSSLFSKENSPATCIASPMKNLAPQSKKVDVSSPLKKTRIPRKDSLTKHNLADLCDQSSKTNSDELNENRIGATSLERSQKSIRKTSRSIAQKEKSSSLKHDVPNLIISACVTPQQQLLVEEKLSASSAVASPIRILSLRNKNVVLSPSTKKTRNTPRKASVKKNNVPEVNSQTPKKNSVELNVNRIASSPLEIVQNSTCNTPRLQEQRKENIIPKLHIIRCESPRPQLLVKENSPVISAVASPIKILSLRGRNVDVSPSPKKTRNTPRKALFTKTDLLHINRQTSKNSLDELKDNRESASLVENTQGSTCSTSKLQEQAKDTKIPSLQVISCETPRNKLLVKENSPVANTVSSPLRILCLRTRKVDVTPSPNKKTPKRTPRAKKTPVK